MRNVKGFALSLVFAIIGIIMFIFFISTGFPAMEHDVEVCTEPVEAVVIENIKEYVSDHEGGSKTEYNQIVEYTYGNTSVKATLNQSQFQKDLRLRYGLIQKSQVNTLKIETLV